MDYGTFWKNLQQGPPKTSTVGIGATAVTSRIGGDCPRVVLQKIVPRAAISDPDYICKCSIIKRTIALLMLMRLAFSYQPGLRDDSCTHHGSSATGQACLAGAPT